MKLAKPPGLLAGFHAEPVCDGIPQIAHAGEQWAPAVYGIPFHRHAVWELYVQLDGESTWETSDDSLNLGPGDFLVMPPGMDHGLVHTSPRHHYAYIGLDVDAWLDRMPELRPYWKGVQAAVLPGGDPLRSAFRHLIAEVGALRELRDSGVRTATDHLMLEATRTIAGMAAGMSQTQWSRPVAQAEELIRSRPEEPWRLDTLARLTNTSPSHLARTFREQVGVPPHRYLLQERIDLAKDLLRNTDLTVGEIALECGFGTCQRFAKAFRQQVGLTAGEYRSSR